MAASARFIATHSGTFHADEACAIAMLRFLPSYANHAVRRTREPHVYADADVVVDVGGEYAPDRHRYDHHQRTFLETMSPRHVTKLSSAGLIYKHFGRDILRQITGCKDDAVNELIFNNVYTEFVEALDAIDNGIEMHANCGKPAYKSHTDLSSRIARLNPAWNERNINIDERFSQAVELASVEFLDQVLYTFRVWLPARTIVEQAMYTRYQHDASGEIVVLSQSTVWKSHLLAIEEEQNINTHVLYVIYEDNDSWRIQAVPIDDGSFESRLQLPEPWRGLRDDTLSEITGIPGCIFCHASGFIGGNKSREGALRMAKLALSYCRDHAVPVKKARNK